MSIRQFLRADRLREEMNTRTYQNHQIYLVPAAISFIALLTFYFFTMPQGLTWDLGGTDGAELAAAALSNGLVHSPGYPTWLLTAKLFLLIPVYPIGLRLNIFSAVVSALSAGILVYTTGIYLRPTTRWLTLLIPVVFGTHVQVWTQSVITEVYALAALFCALILLVTARLIVSLDQKLDYYWLFLFGLLTGLGLGSHYFVGLISAFGLILIGLESGSLKRVTHWGWLAGGLAIGLLVFLYLPIQAGSSLINNWGNPDTLDRFWWVISGAAFTNRFHPNVSLFQMGSLVGHSIRELGYIPLALAIAAIIAWRSRGQRRFWPIIGLALINLYFVAGYNSADTLPYLIPLLLILSLLSVAGLDYLIRTYFNELKNRRYASLASIIILGAAILGSRTMQNWDLITSTEPTAETFVIETVPSLPANAIVFSDDGRKSFALRYGIEVYDRHDIVPVDVSLLYYDWYRVDVARQLGLDPTMAINQFSKENPSRLLSLLPNDDRPIVILDDQVMLR